MRRLCILLAVLVTAAMVPGFALANDAEVAELNQKVAEQIASDLDMSDQLNGCSVTVRYQNGVVWLRGDVFRVDQREAASSVVLDTPGVIRVVNELQIVANASTQELMQTPGAMRPELHPDSSLGHWSAPTRSQESRDVVPVVAMEVGLPSTPPAPIALADPMLPAPVVTPRAPTATHAAALVQADPPAPLSIPSSTMPMQQPVPMNSAMTQAAPVSSPQCVRPSYGQSAPMRYDTPNLPNYAYPSYAASPYTGNIGYPRQYEASAWPYIGPFYPYPQVPLGWRKVTVEWHDGGWYANFDDGTSNSRSPFSAFFRPHR
jgi:hypothetical protein